MSSTTSAALTSSTSASSDNSNPGGPSSPLLFFVALGFGVVFTNLWIIVGVKYCFRYNRRNQARLNGDDPDAVDLAQMPRQRRRREKKLMSMEEVNAKFPQTKYKTWRSTRAQEGLPTAGGITTAPSRPGSMKNVPVVSEDLNEKKEIAVSNVAESSTEKAGSSESGHALPEIVGVEASRNSVDHRPKTAMSSAATQSETIHKTASNEEDEEPEQIEIAIPAEQLPDPGDACAICIDNIEDDDDIRGLTCGHAFHASCVDPWLTSRRACCPLCKADYYVPKPRPEGEAEETRRRIRTEESTAFTILAPGRGGFRVPARFISGPLAPVLGEPRAYRSSRWRPQQRNYVSAAEAAPQSESERRTWRERLSVISLPTMPAMTRVRNGRNVESGEISPRSIPTPAQLEAGR